jgi:hypothetical protein
VKAEQKISSTEGNFQGVLENNDLLGASVAALGESTATIQLTLSSGRSSMTMVAQIAAQCK